MKYLVDTSVIVDFTRNRKKAIDLLKKIAAHNLFINIIVWSEIVYGVFKSNHPDREEIKFSSFLKDFDITVLSIDQPTAKEFTKTKIDLEKKGKRLPDFDLLIASSATVNKLTLVTNNKKHFSRIPGLKIY